MFFIGKMDCDDFWSASTQVFSFHPHVYWLWTILWKLYAPFFVGRCPVLHSVPYLSRVLCVFCLVFVGVHILFDSKWRNGKSDCRSLRCKTAAPRVFVQRAWVKSQCGHVWTKLYHISLGAPVVSVAGALVSLAGTLKGSLVILGQVRVRAVFKRKFDF